MSEEGSEGVNIYVTPEISKHTTANSKNKSPQSFPESKEKHVPHYLRTSTSSCHDLCKNGVKHDLEVKKRLPVRQKFLGASKGLHVDEKDQATPVAQLERRKKQNSKVLVSREKNLVAKKPLINKQNDPPEKIIQISNLPPEKTIQLSDSLPNLEEFLAQDSMLDFSSIDEPTDILQRNLPDNQAGRSTEESSSIKLITTSILVSNEPDEHKSTDPLEVLPEEPITIKFNPFQNNSDCKLAHTEGSSCEPVIVKLVISSSVKHTNYPDLQTASNVHEEILEEPGSVDLAETFPANSKSAEHVTSNGSDVSPVEDLSVRPENFTNLRYGKNKFAKSAEECTLEGVCKEEKLLTDRRLREKAKRNMSKLKGSRESDGAPQGSKVIKPAKINQSGERNGSKTNSATVRKPILLSESEINQSDSESDGAPQRSKVIKPAKINQSGERNGTKTNSATVRKPILLSELEAKQKIASLTPKVIKRKALYIGKTTDTSAEHSTPMKNKDLLVRTTSRSVSSGGIAQKGLEKIIKNLSQPSNVEKVLGKLLRSVSLKSRSSRVPSTKIRINRNLNPVSQVKIQTITRRLGVEKETSKSSELKLERASIKNMKQNMRKKNSSLLGGKDKDSGTKFCESSKSILRREVTRKTSSFISKGETERQHRRTASAHSEEKFTANKRKFSRGKVVSLQEENNVPRILRFRRAKSASENKNAVDTKGSRSRIGRTGADSSLASSEAPTVVLRHQDVQEKKDAQGLLNQVIEETASKLVETRKSKVKALVGAFETVISLQESKVAPHPVVSILSDA